MILRMNCSSLRISTVAVIIAALTQLPLIEPAIAASSSAALSQSEPATATPPSGVSAQLSPSQAHSSVNNEERGNDFMIHKQYEAAIHAYKKVSPKSADVLNKTGIAYQMMFDNEDALKYYLEAAKLDPANYNVLNNIGTVYVSFKDFKSAERYYRKALKIQPDSAIVLKNMGSDLLARKKYKKGSAYYAAALAIDPNIFKRTETPTISNPASIAERGAMNYYMAIGCAHVGLTSCAIDFLRLALNEGYTSPKKIEADGEFASFRGVPEFEQLLESQSLQ